MANTTITKLSPEEARSQLNEINAAIQELSSIVASIDSKVTESIPAIWEGAAASKFSAEWAADKAEYGKKDTNFNDLISACNTSITNIVEADNANATTAHYH